MISPAYPRGMSERKSWNDSLVGWRRSTVGRSSDTRDSREELTSVLGHCEMPYASRIPR